MRKTDSFLRRVAIGIASSEVEGSEVGTRMQFSEVVEEGSCRVQWSEWCGL